MVCWSRYSSFGPALTLTLSQWERGLTEVSLRYTPT
jgi:hypothetical protein